MLLLYFFYHKLIAQAARNRARLMPAASLFLFLDICRGRFYVGERRYLRRSGVSLNTVARSWALELS